MLSPRAPPAPPRAPQPRTAYLEPIVERSIFDSDKVGGPTAQPTGELAPTELDYILLATIVADPPEHSSALIGKPGTRRTRVRKGRRRVVSRGIEDARAYGLGAALGDDARIVRIDQGEVLLERPDGRRELLLIGDPRDEEAPATAAKAPGDDGVEKLDGRRWAVDQEVIDGLANDPSQLAKLGRARPRRQNGEVVGYRLSRIRRGSLGRTLGLRTGDVVHAVNGKPLTSASAALEAWRELSDARELEVELTRRGKRRSHTYEVR